MSGLARFFGGKQTAQAKVERAKEQLNETLQMLMKKSDVLEKKIETELATARKCGMANKKNALRALRRKKMFENELKNVDGTIQIMESQLAGLDNTHINQEVFKTIKAAAASMKVANRNLTMDDVTRTVDEIREQQEIAQEISNVISDPAGFGIEEDEDELLEELMGLQEETLKNDLLDVEEPPAVSATDLPDPGTAKPEKEKKDDAALLAELAEWAQ